MRRFHHIAVSCAVLALVGCAVRGNGPVPQVAQGPALRSAAARARGAIRWMHYVRSFTIAQLGGASSPGLLGTAEEAISAFGGAPKCGVALYAIDYETVGVKGEPATASEGFFVPQRGCKGPFTLVGYGQGTNDVKAQKISDPTSVNIEPQILAAIFAAHGYPVAATDYLGLGYSSYAYQPYLVVNSEASAVIDAMRAARAAAAELHVRLNGKIFLTGHSQGGHTALGTQKVIEAQNAAEFNLFADSPSSGPYALAQSTVGGLDKPGEGAPIYSAYMVTAYNKTYANIYQKAAAIFQSPYAAYVNDLLPVATYAQENALNGKTLPLTLTRLYRPSFLRSLRDDPRSGARLDLQANDLLGGWTPKAPVYLCGGSDDPVVDFENSIVAYQYLKRRGAKVQLLDVNSDMPPSVTTSEYHDAVLILCHTLERVAVLDSPAGRVYRTSWPSALRGPIGPFR
ncbi:MAG TPA: hypothetical protein VMH02_02875 [Verrucomicrobiae bacterium]|nr:hypothetical protein [Verrucomicrobiae bacterium]